MRLAYLPVQALLSGIPRSWCDETLTFMLRSVIGKELRGMSCVFKKKECTSCLLAAQCLYARLFESVIDKDSCILPGRDRASHPFTLFGEPTEQMVRLHLLLMGEAVDFFPHFYVALTRAGECGIGRERHPFQVKSLSSGDDSLFLDRGAVTYRYLRREWRLEKNAGTDGEPWREITIEFISPVRVKREGRLATELSYRAFLEAVVRRMTILCGLYGEGEAPPFSFFEQKEETAHLGWWESKRWSARQQREMMLGGLIGMLRVRGRFSPLERSLLTAAVLFGVGKNTSFGLGRIKISGFGDTDTSANQKEVAG